jgi:hypothetical protein
VVPIVQKHLSIKECGFILLLQYFKPDKNKMLRQFIAGKKSPCLSFSSPSSEHF